MTGAVTVEALTVGVTVVEMTAPGDTETVAGMRVDMEHRMEEDLALTPAVDIQIPGHPVVHPVVVTVVAGISSTKYKITFFVET